jgi:tetratricopeptide (TPR) repeat protein
MVGKISAVLAKKEAEVYRAQGLHKEALRLYSRLLTSTPNIDRAIKVAIRAQMQGIHKELDDFCNQRNQPLSAQEISKIKDGWGDDACSLDILVCAHAFCQVGAYDDALEEIKRLLKLGFIGAPLFGPLADCLIHLNEARDLPAAVSGLIQDASLDEEKAATVQIELAAQLESQTDGRHALALYRHLEQDPEMGVRSQSRLSALTARLQASAPDTTDESMPHAAVVSESHAAVVSESDAAVVSESDAGEAGEPESAPPLDHRWLSLNRLLSFLRRKMPLPSAQRQD